MATVQPAIGVGQEAGTRVQLDRWTLFALFTLVAIAIQSTSLGSPSRHTDEAFYFLVGQEMHKGLLPYVDIWDRKPFGLFAIYYLIAGVSKSVWSYQIAACMAAGAAALAISEIVARWGARSGAIFAGLAFLFVAVVFEGATGQTPDFYNPLIACAALFVSGEIDRLGRGEVRWQIYAAMALGGVAITIKQTSMFEAIFFGLTVLYCLHRSRVGWPRLLGVGAVCALIGALPMVSIAAFYALAGHWSEFYHAMVLSNFSKVAEKGELWRLLGDLLRAAALIILALLGLWKTRIEPRYRAFLACWMVAAVVGFLSVPNFYTHYSLPVMVPLAVGAGLAFDRWRGRALVLIVAVGIYSTFWYNLDQREWRAGAIQSMQESVDAIRRLDTGGGLLVFDGPPLLYTFADKPLLTPLAFPHHLNFLNERNVSHIDTHAEMQRILANRPGVIVMAAFPRNHPVNQDSLDQVMAYVEANCPAKEIVMQREDRNFVKSVIYGRCREGKGAATGAPAA